MIDELRPKLARIPGIRVYLQNPPPIRIGGTLTKSQYQYTLQAPTERALRVGAAARGEAARLPGFSDVTSDLQLKNPQVTVDIDRDKAAALGVTRAADRSALQRVRRAAGLHDLRAEQPYRVILELEPQYPARSAALSHALRAPSNGPARAARHDREAQPSVGPLTSTTSGQLPAVTLSFNLAPGASLGKAIAAVEQRRAACFRRRSARSFQGTAQAFQSSQARPRHLLAARGPRHLHGARHPVRELHPPDHDPLRPAVRGLRRAATLLSVPDGSSTSTPSSA